MSDRKFFVAFQNLNKLQTLSLYHECFFNICILCLKIIQHGTINSAFIYINIYIYTLMKNDGLSYTLGRFNFWRLNISYTDSALFYLFHLFGFCT